MAESAKAATAARTTTDHDRIRRWVEQRGGHPARVKGTGGNGDPGLLRIDFPGYTGEDTLEPISWQDFFEGFEKNNLAFLYQDDENSRFNKLIERNGTREEHQENTRRRGR